jgi:hypothetical protein
MNNIPHIVFGLLFLNSAYLASRHTTDGKYGKAVFQGLLAIMMIAQVIVFAILTQRT